MEKKNPYGSFEQEARARLHARGLRVTPACLAVLHVLADASYPLSHSDVLAQLRSSQFDPATVYRNLVKLRKSGIVFVASRMDGMDRYALALPGTETHNHPHFVCTECGQIKCLPAELTVSMKIEKRWRKAVREALCELQGVCPSCSQKARSEKTG